MTGTQRKLVMRVEPLAHGFTPDQVAQLWNWIQEFPDSNCDDYGPKTLDDFFALIHEKEQLGVEFYCAKELDLGPVGYFGLLLDERGIVNFHGICFASYVHGTGIAARAISQVLKTYFEERKARKVVAHYFSSNLRVGNFLVRLGFTPEGYFSQETMQHGRPRGVDRVALFPAFFKEVE